MQVDKIPTRVKFTALFGVLMIGPSMVAAIVFGGIPVMLFTAMGFVFLFMVLYFFVIRNYL
jgi:uncharacterized membrane protein